MGEDVSEMYKQLTIGEMFLICVTGIGFFLIVPPVLLRALWKQKLKTYAGMDETLDAIEGNAGVYGNSFLGGGGLTRLNDRMKAFTQMKFPLLFKERFLFTPILNTCDAAHLELVGRLKTTPSSCEYFNNNEVVFFQQSNLGEEEKYWLRKNHSEAEGFTIIHSDAQHETASSLLASTKYLNDSSSLFQKAIRDCLLGVEQNLESSLESFGCFDHEEVLKMEVFKTLLKFTGLIECVEKLGVDDAGKVARFFKVYEVIQSKVGFFPLFGNALVKYKIGSIIKEMNDCIGNAIDVKFSQFMEKSNKSSLQYLSKKKASEVDLIDLLLLEKISSSGALALVTKEDGEAQKKTFKRCLQNEVLKFIINGSYSTQVALQYFFIVAGKKGKEFQSKVCREEHFLGNVVKEVTRLYPAFSSHTGGGATISSLLLDDESEKNHPTINNATTATIIKKEIENKPNVLFRVNTFLIHRSEKYFEKPLEFLPERWGNNSEATTTLHHAWLPVSCNSAWDEFFKDFLLTTVREVGKGVLMKYTLSPLKANAIVPPPVSTNKYYDTGMLKPTAFDMIPVKNQ